MSRKSKSNPRNPGQRSNHAHTSDVELEYRTYHNRNPHRHDLWSREGSATERSVTIKLYRPRGRWGTGQSSNLTLESVSRAPAACCAIGQNARVSAAKRGCEFHGRQLTQTATQTSQLQPIPRKKIWCHSGSLALCLCVTPSHEKS